MTPRARIAIVAVAVVALVVAFVARQRLGRQDRTRPATPSRRRPPSATTVETTPAGTARRRRRRRRRRPSRRCRSSPSSTPSRRAASSASSSPRATRSASASTSDTADEIHVHGYDVHKDVAAGGSATFSIPATIDGRFVVELENHGDADRRARGPRRDARRAARRARGLGAAARALALPATRLGARPRRQAGPADPALAVRVGARRSCSSRRSSALAVLWADAAAAAGPRAPPLRVPRVLEVLAGALGVAAFAFVVYAGFAGTQAATANLAADRRLRRLLGRHPVRSASCSATSSAPSTRGWPIGKAAGWATRRLGGDAAPEPLPYPTRLGPLARGARRSSSSPGSSSSTPTRTTRRSWRSWRWPTPRCSSIGMSLYGVERVVAPRRRVRRLLLAVRPHRRRCTGATARCTRGRRWPARRR